MDKDGIASTKRSDSRNDGKNIIPDVSSSRPGYQYDPDNVPGLNNLSPVQLDARVRQKNKRYF